MLLAVPAAAQEHPDAEAWAHARITREPIERALPDPLPMPPKNPSPPPPLTKRRDKPKEPDPVDPFDAALAAGGIGNFIPEGGAPVDWQVHVDAEGPLVVGSYDRIRLDAKLGLTLETGKSVADIASYRAVDFDVDAMHRISKSDAGLVAGQRITTSIGLAAGFAALHDRAEGAPLNSSPSWTKIRARASVKEKGKLRAWLEADYGPDQRLGGRWRPVLGVSGMAEIPLAEGSQVKAMIVGRALKALKKSTTGEPDWQVQLGVMLSV